MSTPTMFLYDGLEYELVSDLNWEPDANLGTDRTFVWATCRRKGDTVLQTATWTLPEHTFTPEQQDNWDDAYLYDAMTDGTYYIEPNTLSLQ
jgi:hypothetical protein